ncbi:MAG: cellulase family glycosylhydrolase [Candidatus Nitrosocaldaceae archaeon]
MSTNTDYGGSSILSLSIPSTSLGSNGTHHLEFYAIDRANNRSSIGMIRFATAPYTIDGNKLIDTSTNKEIILYGAHISRPEIFDPSKTLAYNNWRDVATYLQKDIAELKSIGANAIRLGISPAWMKYNNTGSGELRLDYYIESAISAAISNGMYVLLDFHAIDATVYPYTKGSTTYGKRYDDTKTTYELMQEFWARYAPLYNGRRDPLHIRYVFFELFNEEVRNAENISEWMDYKAKMEYVISNIIRPNAPYNVIIVNGLNNGLNLRRVAEGYNIKDPKNLLIYGWHPYPNSVRPTYTEREALTDYYRTASSSWDWNLGARTATTTNANAKPVPSIYPTLITEFGWRDPNVRTDLTDAQKNEYGGRYVRDSNKYDYGKSILTYSSNMGIKGYFPFRFYYEKLAIVGQMPDWWNPNRSYTYTSDYGTIIRAWFTDKSIP